MFPIVKMENIVKRFPLVCANDHINFEVKKGEIHCLLGENGAGKTTLMNILYGLYGCDEGKIFIKGEEVCFNGPSDAIKKGIGMVHQHFMLIPVFTIIENLILGAEPTKRISLDIKKAEEEITALSQKYQLNIDPQAYVMNISVGMQQRAEILKLLYRGAKIMIFDEPTAILTPQKVKELYKIMNFLRESGHTIIFITHKLKEVMDISDRVTVLRDGKVVDTIETSNTNSSKLAKMMVGREVLFRTEKPKKKVGKTVLEVKDIFAKNQRGLPALRGLNLEVSEGEIVGIAGIDGNGQTELVEVLTGLRKVDDGKIIINGEDLTNKETREFFTRGRIAHIPEDRLLRGLIVDFPLYENFILGLQDNKPFAKGIFLDIIKVKEFSQELLYKYDIRGSNIEALADTLSGGNQQKVVIARELQRNPKLIIASQPTRGLDVGATEFVHQQIIKQSKEGKAILLISLELSEIMNLSDRIIVIYEGKFRGEFNAQTANEGEIGLMMAGGGVSVNKNGKE
ncbi:MAG TPA: ABC transporter ATP-binding protein [Candidatus Atribacteria bacterium]|jgi:simple sugar transport system ATP-binding protein|nr:ABC transporter ATP-binding protein [Candidatus Atribacteria bacterium]